MSNGLARYESRNARDGGEWMTVTACGAGRPWPLGVQFTIGGHYCALNGAQVRDLVERLQKRLRGEPGYSATDLGEEVLVCLEGIQQPTWQPFPQEREPDGS